MEASVVTKSSPGKSKRLIYIPQGLSCGSVGSRTWGRTETSEGSKGCTGGESGEVRGGGRGLVLLALESSQPSVEEHRVQKGATPGCDIQPWARPASKSVLG